MTLPPMPDIPGVPIGVRRAIYWFALAVAGAGLMSAKLDHGSAALAATMIVSALGQVMSLIYTRPAVRRREAERVLDADAGRHRAE